MTRRRCGRGPPPDWVRLGPGSAQEGSAPMRARLAAYVSVLAVAVLTASLATPAAADPGDEGSTSSLNAELADATRGYVDASAKAEASKARQADLTAQLADVEGRFAVETEAVKVIAV